mmetsp:Transcript_8736/g.17714  ORF Transcript_8736/g.17714 Transcript_8736/m.17714 type:complete len:188 (+) Transcript_8736:1596-2159(+)
MTNTALQIPPPKLVVKADEELKRAIQKSLTSNKCESVAAILSRDGFGSLLSILPYIKFDLTRSHTRIPIICNDTYTVHLSSWTPGKQSPISDQGDSHCWMKVIVGSVTETRFHIDSNRITREREMILSEGDTTFIRKTQLHQLSSSNSEEGALTLHICSPPMTSTKLYMENESVKKVVLNRVTFDQL